MVLLVQQLHCGFAGATAALWFCWCNSCIVVLLVQQLHCGFAVAAAPLRFLLFLQLHCGFAVAAAALWFCCCCSSFAVLLLLQLSEVVYRLLDATLLDGLLLPVVAMCCHSCCLLYAAATACHCCVGASALLSPIAPTYAFLCLYWRSCFADLLPGF